MIQLSRVVDTTKLYGENEAIAILYIHDIVFCLSQKVTKSIVVVKT